MESKYIIFLIFLSVAIPVGVLITRLWKPAITFVFVFMCAAMVEPERLGVNFMSRPEYRMITRGLEFTLVDILALILFFGMLLRPIEFKFKLFPAMSFNHLFYILVIIISWIFVEASTLEVPGIRYLDDFTIYPPEISIFEIGLYPLFELVKICRGFFIFWLSYTYLRNTEQFELLTYICAFCVFYCLLIALQQRYIHGVMRVYANIGHANSLSTFIVLHATVVLMAAVRQKKLLTSFFLLSVAGCAILIIILTISRGGLLAIVVGYSIIGLITLKKFLHLRNIVYMNVAAIVFFWMLLYSFDTLKQRFFQDAVEDYKYRNDYNVESMFMLKDHFFGVGMGNYSAYSWYKYAEKVDEKMFPGTPAHNFIFLNLAELGYLGLLMILLIFLRFFQISFLLLKEKLSLADRSFVYSLVIGVSLMLFQEFLNFSYRQMPVLFTFMIFSGALVAKFDVVRQKSKEDQKVKTGDIAHSDEQKQ
jgi:hypothetical protein